MAAETKDVENITELISLSEIDISIKTSYRKIEKPFIIEAFIEEEMEIVNGVSLKEGELGVTMINSPERIDVSISPEGFLRITTDDDDANNYSINEDGYLTYTYP